MWRIAQLKMRRTIRVLAEDGEPPAVPLGALITEFTGAIRSAASFPEAMPMALSILRERTGAQSITLLEKAAGAVYRCGEWADTG